MYKKQTAVRNRSVWRRIGAILVIAIVLVAAFIAWPHLRQTDSSSQVSSDGISYRPPTKQEKADSENHKDAIVSTNNTNVSSKASTNSSGDPNASSPKTKVYPRITTWNPDATSFTLNGFVEGVVESDGTCKLTLTNGGKVVTATHNSFANATNTSCGQIKVAKGSLYAGTWQAVLSYSSSTSQGTSSATSIEVK